MAQPPPPPPNPPPPGPLPPPGTAGNFSQADLKRVADLLDQRKSSFFANFKDVIGSSALAGAKDIAQTVQDVYDESLRQANQYEREIVDQYGDISTQQEQFGKSAAKLAVENTNLLRQEFLQLEEGGIKMMDAYENADDASRHATDIMDQFQGSAYQFMDDLEGSNLRVVQLLSRASGISAEQTSDIMKLAKARGEDSKQMLADIGTFSKALSDKFSLDTKVVAEGVAQITTNVSTFGRVSIEAATAASARFAALGLSVSDVSDSIGRTFGNFGSAADASAKLSQALGVNIDSMQMMVDVNSGPEGMSDALERLRENVIGAGIDVSQLSAPMVRTFKEITGITDDKTLFAMFDPERAGIDADAIMEEAKKAADAQKTPTEALKLLDGDIGKFKRNLEGMTQLVNDQNIQRLGGQAKEASLGMADLSSASATFFDGVNQFVQKQPAFEAGLKSFNDKTRDLSNSTVGLLDVSTKAIANDFAKANPDAQPLYEARPQSGLESRTKIGQGVLYDTEYQQRIGMQLSDGQKTVIAAGQQIVDAVALLKSDTSTEEERKGAFGQLTLTESVTQSLVAGLAKLVPTAGYAAFAPPEAATTPPLAQAEAATAASTPPPAAAAAPTTSVVAAPPAAQAATTAAASAPPPTPAGAAVRVAGAATPTNTAAPENTAAAVSTPSPASAGQESVAPAAVVPANVAPVVPPAVAVPQATSSAPAAAVNMAQAAVARLTAFAEDTFSNNAAAVASAAQSAVSTAQTAATLVKKTASVTATGTQAANIGTAVASAVAQNIDLKVYLDVSQLSRALAAEGRFAIVRA